MPPPSTPVQKTEKLCSELETPDNAERWGGSCLSYLTVFGRVRWSPSVDVFARCPFTHGYPCVVYRWRALVGEDPDEDQLAAKIHLLEERLSLKKDQLLEKDLVLEEVRAPGGIRPQ